MVFKERDLLEVEAKVQRSENEILMDLGLSYELESLRIYNGTRDSFSIEISSDGERFENLGEKFILAIESHSDYLEIPLYQEVCAKFLKIVTCEDTTSKKKLECKAFVRKFSGLFIAPTWGGWGDRVIGILNCMAMAKHTGFKWGFVWNRSVGSNFGNPTLNAIDIDAEDKIFSQEFLQQYSYTGRIPANGSYATKANARSLEDFKTKPYQHFWGHYFFHGILNYEGLAKDYARDYPQFWQSIKWNKNIEQLLQKAQECAEKLKSEVGEYVSLHIRSGDIVFAPHYQDLLVRDKATPAEIAMEIIERLQEQGKAVLLFGEDAQELEALAKTYKNAYNSKEFLEANLNETHTALFEITLMSQGSEIWTNGGAGFARLASLISKGREPQSWQSLWNKETIYQIMEKNANKILFKPQQVAYSRKLLANLHFDLFSNDAEKLLRIVEESLTFNEQVKSMQLLEVLCLVALERFQRAEKKAQVFIKNGDLDSLLRSAAFDSWRHSENTSKHFAMRIIDKFAKLDAKFIALNILASKLYGLEFARKAFSVQNSGIAKEQYDKLRLQQNNLQSASLRVQSHLAYKLGQAMILNSKNLWGIMRLPYVLSYIKESHKIEQKQYQEKITKNPNLKLPPLESYADYKEALKIKNYTSYKLGEGLIAANRAGGGGNIALFAQSLCG